MLKNFALTSFLVLASGSAFAGNLSGEYIIHTTDCLHGEELTDARTAVVTEGPQAVSLQILVKLPQGYGEGLQEVTGRGGYLVGDTGRQPFGIGSGDMQITGLYSAGGNHFVYAEYDSQYPNGPMSLLRTTTFERIGAELTITNQESGFEPQSCILSKK